MSLEQQEDQVTAKIFINKDHSIFKGHFPGNPVMPGVCIMQIIKELTEQIVKCKLFMAQSSNIKFKAIINPETHPELQMQLKIKEEKDIVKIKNVTTFISDPNTIAEGVNKGAGQTTVALQLSAAYNKVPE